MAHAGKAIGTVNLVYTQGDLIFVSIGGYNASTGSDASFCSTIGEFALDGSTASGKNLYAMLLTARALEAQVAFTGTGTCSLNAARENIAYGALTSN